jgi:glucose/arabinose dehydrogenase
MNPDGSNIETIARGVRNTVGFDFDPKTGNLWFTDNGRDWLSEDLPNDELNVVTKPDQHFGYPYCHQGNILDSEFGWGKRCDDYQKPAALLGPHAAALGLTFYNGKSFPAKYRARCSSPATARGTAPPSTPTSRSPGPTARAARRSSPS